MKLNIIEDDKSKLVVEVEGENLTLTNLVARKVNEQGTDSASFEDHPFLTEPKILVIGSSPKKKLQKAADAVIKECEEFSDEFKKALK